MQKNIEFELAETSGGGAYQDKIFYYKIKDFHLYTEKEIVAAWLEKCPHHHHGFTFMPIEHFTIQPNGFIKLVQPSTE